MQIATMTATAEATRSASGDISRYASRYEMTLDGDALGTVGTLRAAAERRANALGGHLPRDPARWGVQVSCPKTGVSGGVGNYPGRGGPAHPCMARVLGDSAPRSLREALSAMAKVVGDCCE